VVKKQIVQLEENKKHAYALIIGFMDPLRLCKPRLIKTS
jgi:hypothetical protein